MRELPSAWKLPGPEWAPLAPGVRWLLKRPDGAVRAFVSSEVSGLISRVFDGRAGMETLGLDESPEFDAALSLERIQGLASVATACLYAKHCLIDWEGIDDPTTGQSLDPADPDAIRAALLHGPPPWGQPLLSGFLSWLEAPRRPMAREALRLRDLAQDHWGGGAERCRACVDEGDGCAKGSSTEGEICPRLKNAPTTPEGEIAWSIASTTSGIWQRAGMGASIIGLDYGSALLTFESLVPSSGEPDFGAAYVCFRAIEAGRMQAEAAKAAAEPADA